MHRLMSRALLVLCSSTLAVACGDSPPAPTFPTAGPPTTITDVFEGQIDRNGAVTHPFLAEASGNITATLDSLVAAGAASPDSSAPEVSPVIGLSLGTWNGSACQTVIANDSAVQGASLLGTASVASNLCLRVYDTGKTTAPTAYRVTVVHP